jgi:hypothetical protein
MYVVLAMTQLDQALEEQPEIGYDSATDSAIAWDEAISNWMGGEME